ncbi:hypothetical protein ACH4LS_29005 [Streptomyces luteogriseus]|uniref:hypothetical protein n=1 Tax=Streptomyces luteogriseus TaxID=68233 RepID=UPI0037B85467
MVVKGSMPWASWATGGWHELVQGQDFDSERALRSGASRWARSRGLAAEVRTVRTSAGQPADSGPRRFRIRITGPALAELSRTRMWTQLALFPLKLVQLPKQPRQQPA